MSYVEENTHHSNLPNQRLPLLLKGRLLSAAGDADTSAHDGR